jgi:endonuclease/exonuclease/phosphatase family metal-dependent hydrolase
MPFSIATLNIWNRMGPWDERLVAIRTQLASLRPDVIALQEAVRIDGPVPFDQPAIVADGFDYHIAFGSNPESRYPMGNAILSRWPITDHEVFFLPHVDSDERRSVVVARIDTPFGPMPVACTHLNWRFDHGYIREKQIRFVTDRLHERAHHGDFPAILAGDLNAESDADEIRFLRGHTTLGGRSVAFRDAFALVGDGTPGATFARSNPFAAVLREPNRRIDYIFVEGPREDDGRGDPIEARVCFDEPVHGTYASDHYGVIATIRSEP